MKYTIDTKLNKISFEEAISKTKAALKEEGFGVLTEIDIKNTLKEKLDADFRPYQILGACNPPFAYEALKAEPNIGAMLPCNVIVQDLGNEGISISAVDPMASMQAIENQKLKGIAEEIREKLKRVIHSL